MSVNGVAERIKSIGIRRGDLVVVTLLIVLSLLMMCVGLFGGEEAEFVRVCVDGKQVTLLSLDRDVVYEVPGGLGNVVEVSGGRVRMLSADCADGSCVRQGHISRAGECIVCLPARVTVTVISEYDTGKIDAVAY